MRAVGSAAERLLAGGSWEQNVAPVLAELGEAADVSRAYVFRNLEGPEGTLLMDLCFEWTAPGVSPTITNPDNRGYPYIPEYAHYVGKLNSNEAVTLSVSDALPVDRADLVEEGTLSTAFLPIFEGDRWWGFLGFDDCLVERVWSGAELDALRAAAATLGAAVRLDRVNRASRVVEERYRALVEQIPTVIYIDEVPQEEGAELVPVYVSPQIEGLLGYRPDEWISDPDLWDRTIHPDDVEATAAAGRDAYHHGTPLNIEYRMITRDRRIVWVREEAALFRDEDGKPKFWQGVYIDITDMKRSEEELNNALIRERDATEQLRALDEMKNTFLQAVSHDLRTPLAAILGLALTLTRDDIDLDEPVVRDLAARIATNSRRLDRMVTDLLDLDRLSRGIIAPNLHHTEIAELARALLAELDMGTSRRLELDLEPVTIKVDPPKVERILENLLVNALRHTPANAHIWVKTQVMGGGALITVEDDGPGVPKDLREAIFEPFRQGPSPSSHSPGAGVGLALVSRFAELHRGRAWVEDRPGGGASFKVLLPDGEADPQFANRPPEGRSKNV
jgi:PAS domain S-box-containing protein